MARVIALAGVLALLLAACNGDEPEETEEPTVEPSPTASVESLGEFQLVATIEQAFLSIEPGIDLPSDVTRPGEQGEEQETAGVAGVMRGEVEAFSDNLRDRCGADDGDRFNLFWTTGTLFDQTLLDRSLELELEGRRIGVIGSIFMRGAQATDSGEEFDLGEESPGTTTAPPATTTPVPSPGVTTAEGEDDCVLVVQQVGISAGGALPTRRPTATASPTAAATRSPRRRRRRRRRPRRHGRPRRARRPRLPPPRRLPPRPPSAAARFPGVHAGVPGRSGEDVRNHQQHRITGVSSDQAVSRGSTLNRVHLRPDRRSARTPEPLQQLGQASPLERGRAPRLAHNDAR